MYTLKGGAGKMLRAAVCVSVCVDVRLISATLLFEECLRSGWQQMVLLALARSVGVTHKSVFSLLHYRGIDVVGAGCERTVRSTGLASCAVAAGSIHHNLTFNRRGAELVGKTRQQRKREERDKAKGTEREEGTECIYTWVMDLLWSDFFVLGGG